MSRVSVSTLGSAGFLGTGVFGDAPTRGKHAWPGPPPIQPQAMGRIWPNVPLDAAFCSAPLATGSREGEEECLWVRDVRGWIILPTQASLQRLLISHYASLAPTCLPRHLRILGGSCAPSLPSPLLLLNFRSWLPGPGHHPLLLFSLYWYMRKSWHLSKKLRNLSKIIQQAGSAWGHIHSAKTMHIYQELVLYQKHR